MGLIALRTSGDPFGHLGRSAGGTEHHRIHFRNQMNKEFPALRLTELDATNFPEWRNQLLAYEAEAGAIQPRTYPGYPRWLLQRVGPRPWPSLDRSLPRRRSAGSFSAATPSR